MKSKKMYSWLAPLLALVILAAMALQQARTQASLGDPTVYHAKVRVALDRVPYQVDNWVGVDVEVPAAAVTMLKPNVILSRRYTHLLTGQSISLLFVHCRDARDLLGHYPPVCYVGQGWVMQKNTASDWQAGDLPVTGTFYEFTRQSQAQQQGIMIANFMVTPDGRILREMDALRKFAKDRHQKVFGAGQGQIVLDASMQPEQAQATIELFVQTLTPLIRVTMQQER